MKITLDTNCLIDLEKNECAVNDLQNLILQHDSERITIAIPGIGASERMKEGTYASTFSDFKARVQKYSNRPFEILKPLAYREITYYDWCIRITSDMVQLEEKLHNILFPNRKFEWREQAEAYNIDPNEAQQNEHREYKKWVNCKCDTLGLWCHIHYEGDIFVTRDGNFHKETKKLHLEELGAKRILIPSDVNIQ